MVTKIFDIHPHVISLDTHRYPVSPLGGKRSAWSIERPLTFEQLVAAMDEAGVAKAAIVHSSTVYGFNNDYVADVIADHAERFTGVFSVDILADDAPAKIRYWVSRKLTGLRIYSGGSNVAMETRLDDPRSFPVWECAQDLGISVCVSLFPAKLPELLVMIKRFPKVPVVIDGLARAPIDEGPPYTGCAYVFDLARYENVYLKLSTNNVRASRRGKATPESFFPRLVAELGARRIRVVLQLSRFQGHSPGHGQRRQNRARVSQHRGSGVDFSPHGRNAVSRFGRSGDSSRNGGFVAGRLRQ